MLTLQTVFLSTSLVLSAVPAVAAPLSTAPVELAQVYTDLPGVKTPEEAFDAKRIYCEQTVVEREGHPTFAPRYRTINNCRQGDGPVFQSPGTPRSIDRYMRGLDY
ncbi:hypothetical protein [Pararhizobium sp. DWP3-4]|uniref:hypothetical protein n=1 Tax=unclassified Pararhizobium TaxID=2643050 RepID=UPI003CE93E72